MPHADTWFIWFLWFFSFTVNQRNQENQICMAILQGWFSWFVWFFSFTENQGNQTNQTDMGGMVLVQMVRAATAANKSNVFGCCGLLFRMIDGWADIQGIMRRFAGRCCAIGINLLILR